MPDQSSELTAESAQPASSVTVIDVSQLDLPEPTAEDTDHLTMGQIRAGWRDYKERAKAARAAAAG
jgi:hypothetical protein